MYSLDTVPPITPAADPRHRQQTLRGQPLQPNPPALPPRPNNLPFFPHTSPPAPTHSTRGCLPAFPANASLILPKAPSASRHRQVVAIALSVSLVSVLLVGTLVAVMYLYVYRRQVRRCDFATGNRRRRASNIHSFRLFRLDNAAPVVVRPPKPLFSSDSLHLGTLHNRPGSTGEIHDGNGDIGVPGMSPSPPYHKLGSPEIKPLPSQPRISVKRGRNSKVGCDDEEEEFFSPIGSSPDQRDSIGKEPTGDLPYCWRDYPGIVGVDRSGSQNIDSGTASRPFSVSGSSKNNASSNRSSQLNSSSPEVMILKLPVPPRQPPPTTQQSPSSNVSQSPASLPSLSKQFEPRKLPPLPPLMPPARFWERPQAVQDPVSGPPVMAEPSRHVQVRSNCVSEVSEDTPRPKLKPLHWDKVQACSDQDMVWDQFKCSSFQLDEEMIETLFMVNGSNPSQKDNSRCPIMLMPNQENQVLDPKKSQNVSILLRALHVTVEEVCEALTEGNADSLESELLESLLKMAPTKEEERKLRDFKEDSQYKLGPAEKFLKALLDIPFAFKRVDALLYMVNFESEFEYLERSFETLQAACNELRNSRMFLKILQAVLKAGNRMNVGTSRGDARAFKLDTLLKLVDVKGTDGKTTLLHFVVQEIVRSEGSRLLVASGANDQCILQNEVELKKLGLPVVSGLSGELGNVKKAAIMDSTVLSNEVSRLTRGVSKINAVLGLNVENDVKQNFLESMKGFLIKAEGEIRKIQEQEGATLKMVREITEYFHGNLAKEEAHPLRIFMVVRDFLSTLDQVCRDVGKANERNMYGSDCKFRCP